MVAPAPRTVLDRLVETAAARPGAPALRRFDGRTGRLTWGAVADQVARVAAGLRELGVSAGDHAVLLLPNRPEFHVVDLALGALGAVPISAYGSAPADRLAHIITASQATLLVAAGPEEATRLRASADAAGVTPPMVVLDRADQVADAVPLADLAETGPLDLEALAARRHPDEAAVLLFTSGTSGPAKGVPLTHAHLDAAIWAFTERAATDLTGLRQLSYLPMAHIGERFATHYLAVAHGTEVVCLDDLGSLHEAIRAVRPQFLFGAPRMWELLHDEACRVGAQPLQALGLDAVEVAIVGSAPLPRRVHEYWLEQGVPLADFYGQTESTGMGTWSPDDIRPGTCGRPLPGVELRIVDEEIQLRGPNLFAGYHGAEAATAQAFTTDGWYRTGDRGWLDGQDLVVAGRLGDLLVPTSGHNVPPAPLEHALVRADVVAHACVVGTGRPHLAAVVALDHGVARDLVVVSDVEPKPGVPLHEHPEVVAAVDVAVAAANADRPPAEAIRSVLIVEDEWTPGTAVVTLTNKLRRSAVLEVYGDRIDQIYGAAQPETDGDAPQGRSSRH